MVVHDVDDAFIQSGRKAEARHRTEMKGWKTPLSRRDASVAPDRSYLFEIRSLVPSRIPVAARAQGVTEGPSRPVNIAPQHSLILAMTNAHTSPYRFPTTQRVDNRPSCRFDIAS